MASGFITLGDGRGFSVRWTGFDEIIKILVKELSLGNKQQQELSDWLKEFLPNEEKGDIEMGWGFVSKKSQEIINRSLDLRELTLDNQKYIMVSLQKGYNKMIKDDEYSHLYPEILKDLLRKIKLTKLKKDPQEESDFRKIMPYSGLKIGPGWKNDTLLSNQ